VIGEQQIGIANDRSEYVVEVVRHASGELSDGLHFMALREVLLQGALLGGVEREDGRARAFVGARIGGPRREPGRARRAGSFQRDVERRDLALAPGPRPRSMRARRMIALRHDVENRKPSLGDLLRR